ncbi:MAG: NADP-dependent oxidoreductase [Ureaplasma sp.]|nr:NADP-dependent oxidoreductase [Ureaplasma sp.]
MKAALLKKYKKNNYDLEICEIDKPTVNNNEVLVKVKTMGVNPLDNMITTGQINPIIKYKLPTIAGNELVGEIIETKSTKFKIGDRIYSRLPINKIGAFAEYVALNEKDIALVPEYLNDEEAACIPLAALTAMQAFDLLNIEKDKIILITGASGSFGAIAVQLAKYFGLYVIATGNEVSRNRLLNLGANEYYDYKNTNIVDSIKDVDYIIDAVGNKESLNLFKCLKSGGTFVSLKGMPNKEFAERMGFGGFKKMLFSIVGKKYDNLAKKNNQKYRFLFVESNGEQLQKVSKILEETKIQPTIDSVWDFKDINKVMNKLVKGKSIGKVVLKFN